MEKSKIAEMSYHAKGNFVLFYLLCSLGIKKSLDLKDHLDVYITTSFEI